MINLRKAYRKVTKVTNFQTRSYLVCTAFTSAVGYIWYKWHSSEKEAIRIGAAGLLSVFAVEAAHFPLDSLNNKTKLQKEMNTYQLMKHVYKTEGYWSFCKGFTSIYYGWILYGYLYFSIYKYLKHVLRPFFEERNSLTTMYFLVAGISDYLALLVYYPFEVLKVRMQCWEHQYGYAGISEGFKDLYKNYGIFGIHLRRGNDGLENLRIYQRREKFTGLM